VKNGVLWDDNAEPHGVTSQKTPFFIVTAVKTSNLTRVFGDFILSPSSGGTYSDGSNRKNPPLSLSLSLSLSLRRHSVDIADFRSTVNTSLFEIDAVIQTVVVRTRFL
jgi:hypothetical protein